MILVELRRPQPAVLQLLKGLARFAALMLPCVAEEQHPVLRLDLIQKSLNLLRAGQAGLIEQIEMSAGGIACSIALLASGKEALERRCSHASVAELRRSAGVGAKPSTA